MPITNDTPKLSFSVANTDPEKDSNGSLRASIPSAEAAIKTVNTQNNNISKKVQNPTASTDQFTSARWFSTVKRIASNFFNSFSKGKDRSTTESNLDSKSPSKEGILQQITRRTILPAAALYSKEAIQNAKENGLTLFKNKQLNTHFTIEPYTVTTADGVEISATIFKYKTRNKNIPTIISFNPNAALGASLDPLIDFAEILKKGNTPCNLVTFDYRGVGESKGKFESADNLVQDGIAVVKSVQEKLKTSNSKIHFCGRSLGGAIAAKTQAALPEIEGRHVNICSFSSLDKVINSYVPGFIARWANKIVENSGYTISAVDDFKKIKTEKMVVYHPNDQVIPASASMYKQIKETDGVRVLKLCPKKGEEATSLKDHHNASLSSHVDENNVDVQARILNFLINGDDIPSTPSVIS